MRVAVVQGTRPEIAKNYAVVRALRALDVPFEVLHTGQHTRADMCGTVYRDMGYEPSRTHPEPYALGAVIDWLREVFRRDRIDTVLVNGDTAAALAGGVAALYSDLPLAHVEAGLRSHDPVMLEERNRIMVDSIAQLLFAYTAHEVDVLRRSGGIRGTVHLEGNTTVDLVHDFAHRLQDRPVAAPYLFVTLHRKEFTDSCSRMVTVFGVLRRLAEGPCAVVFPMHPRTADAARRWGLPADLLAGVQVVEPVDVFRSLALQKHAEVVLTDSGCVQEEAYLLGTPCVTVRDNTERHLTVQHGANRLTGFDPAAVLDAVRDALAAPSRSWPAIYGEPGAGARIVGLLTGQAGADGPRRLSAAAARS